MKKILFIAILMLSMSACNSAKKEATQLKDSVLNFHEQVMADDEKAMMNKMKLDTLIQQAKVAKADTMAIHQLSTGIVAADNAMTDWMSKLKVDYANADQGEVIKYWQGQQKQVKGIDSMLLKATADAATFISKTKK
jgi:hypothetical protein